MTIGTTDSIFVKAEPEENLKWPVQETCQDDMPVAETSPGNTDQSSALLSGSTLQPFAPVVMPGSTGSQSRPMFGGFDVKSVMAKNLVVSQGQGDYSEPRSSNSDWWGTNSTRSRDVSITADSDWTDPDCATDQPPYSLEGLESDPFSTIPIRSRTRSGRSSGGVSFRAADSAPVEADLVFTETIHKRSLKEWLDDVPMVENDQLEQSPCRYIRCDPDAIYSATYIVYGPAAENQPHAYIDRIRVVKPKHNSSAIEMFIKEMAALYEMEHPNVVKMLGCHSTDSSLGARLVLRQSYAGEPVLPVYRSRTLPEEELVHHFLGFWRAIRHLQVKSVLHRDLCPDNLTLKDGELILIDFDQAVHYRVEPLPSHFAGRYFYAAPEALACIQQYYTADVFAAGMTCLKLLETQGYVNSESLYRVKEKVNDEGQVGKKKRTKPEANYAVYPELSSEKDVPEAIQQVYQLMVNCVALSPDQRPEPDEVVRNLEYLEGRLRLEAQPESRESTPEQSSSHSTGSNEDFSSLTTLINYSADPVKDILS